MSRDWDQFGADYDLPPIDGTPRVYLIASSPRTGSHYLGHLCRACGDMGAPLEYLHPRHLAAWGERLGQEGPSPTVRALMQRRTSPSGWFGLKAHWAQFQPFAADSEMRRTLAVQCWIQIARRDAVAQAVSLVVAKQSRSPISFRVADGPLAYDRAAIKAALERLKQDAAGWEKFFAEEGVTPLRIFYEDLCVAPRASLNAVRACLDLAPVRVLPQGEWMPERQATSLNDQWRARYLEETAGG